MKRTEAFGQPRIQGALQQQPALLDGASARFSAMNLRGPMAEWLRRGLQILARRFDSGSGLQFRIPETSVCIATVAALALFPTALLANERAAAVDAAKALAGNWSNAAQYEAAPAFLKRPPAAGFPYPWIDRQHASFRIVPAPHVTGANGTAVYLEWRKDGPDGPISRQRLWVFNPAPDGVRMAFYAFRTPADYADAGGTPERFAALLPENLIGYGPGCSLALASGPDGWTAQIDEACRITAQSGRTMRLGARIVLNAHGLFYEEEGVLADGTHAFRVPGGLAYEFKRLAR